MEVALQQCLQAIYRVIQLLKSGRLIRRLSSQMGHMRVNEVLELLGPGPQFLDLFFDG